MDEGFLTLLLVDLLPVIVFMAGTRRPATIVVCGLSIFLFTQLGWLLWFAEREDPLAGIAILYALKVNLILAIVAAALDRTQVSPAGPGSG